MQVRQFSSNTQAPERVYGEHSIHSSGITWYRVVLYKGPPPGVDAGMDRANRYEPYNEGLG